MQPSARPDLTHPRGRPAIPALAALALLLLLAPGGSRASQPKTTVPGSIPNAPDFVAGFPIPFFRTTDFRTSGGAVVAADLDGDGVVELVVSVPTGVIAVIRPDGSKAPGWPRTFDALPQPAWPVGSPAVDDLDGDGRKEIVGCVAAGSAPVRSFVYALDDHGLDLPGWPVEARDVGDGTTGCTEAATLTGDLDGDGRPEILRAMSGGAVLAWSADGRKVPGWPFSFGPDQLGRSRPVNADMTVADFDGDGAMELVLVESGSSPRLAVVGGQGTPRHGFPVLLPELVDRQAPAIGDVDGDGIPEVIQTTLPVDESLGLLSDAPSTGPAMPASVHLLRADGSRYPGWPIALQTGAPWGALLTDLDRNGRPEILQQDGDLLYGFDPDGGLIEGFPYAVHRDFVKSQATLVSRWVAADLDGDGGADLLQVRSSVLSGAYTLRVAGLRATGQAVKGFPFDASGWLAASHPGVVDLTGDGVNDLVLLADAGVSGGFSLIAWDLGSLRRGN